jgi:hypothetical protein
LDPLKTCENYFKKTFRVLARLMIGYTGDHYHEIDMDESASPEADEIRFPEGVERLTRCLENTGAGLSA